MLPSAPPCWALGWPCICTDCFVFHIPTEKATLSRLGPFCSCRAQSFPVQTGVSTCLQLSHPLCASVHPFLWVFKAARYCWHTWLRAGSSIPQRGVSSPPRKRNKLFGNKEEEGRLCLNTFLCFKIGVSSCTYCGVSDSTGKVDYCTCCLHDLPSVHCPLFHR